MLPRCTTYSSLAGIKLAVKKRAHPTGRQTHTMNGYSHLTSLADSDISQKSAELKTKKKKNQM
jgi:hypothetical protein